MEGHAVVPSVHDYLPQNLTIYHHLLQASTIGAALQRPLD